MEQFWFHLLLIPNALFKEPWTTFNYFFCTDVSSSLYYIIINVFTHWKCNRYLRTVSLNIAVSINDLGVHLEVVIWIIHGQCEMSFSYKPPRAICNTCWMFTSVHVLPLFVVFLAGFTDRPHGLLLKTPASLETSISLLVDKMWTRDCPLKKVLNM